MSTAASPPPVSTPKPSQTATGPFTDYGCGTASFLAKFIKANTTDSLGYLPDGTGDPAARPVQYPFD